MSHYLYVDLVAYEIYREGTWNSNQKINMGEKNSTYSRSGDQSKFKFVVTKGRHDDIY